MISDDETTRLHHKPCPTPDRTCLYDLDRRAIHGTMKEILNTLSEIQGDIRVSNQRFSILEKIVYGACGVVGLTVLGGLLATIVKV